MNCQFNDEDQVNSILDDGYDIAQVCLNGHLVNSKAFSEQGHNQDYCHRCGKQTILKCILCQRYIRGEYIVDDFSYRQSFSVPKFCISCGNAYPWVDSRIRAAKELADELEELSDDEKALFKGSIDGIIADTPETIVAATRFKKYLIKGGKEIAIGFKDILVEIASETAKKIIWPQQ